MGKSEKFDYIKNKIKVMSVTDFNNFINESPLKNEEKDFITDIYHGFGYDELAEKYNISKGRVNQKKHTLYLRLYDYEFDHLNRISENSPNEKINIENLIENKIQAAFKAKDTELKEKEELLNSLLNKQEQKILNRKLEEIKKTQNLNSRGTKKSQPSEIEDKAIREDIEVLSSAELKRKYIALYAKGEISGKETSNILGITVNHVSYLKKKYLLEGENCSFENQNIGRIPSNKTSEDIINKITDLYENKYKDFAITDFSKILKEEYNINKSQSFIRSVLANNGLKSPTADKFNGKNKDTLGNDYLSVMEQFEKALMKNELTELEEYGLIYICDFAFSKAYLALNSISKIKYKLAYKTSYSLFSDFTEKKYLDIDEEWNHWNKNHDKFSYVYKTPIRYKLIQDIKSIYYPMFKKVEQYIINYKQDEGKNN